MGDNSLSTRELVNASSSNVSQGPAINQENMPLVTAVVPVYNHEKYVVESIRSILSQSYRNIELIIINDGSKDRSHEMVLTLVEECKQRFVRFEYINRENKGLSATLNQALSMAKGKYFSALASDDIALPDKFSLLVDAFKSKDDTYAAAFGNALFVDDRGQEIRLDVNGKACEVRSCQTYPDVLEFSTRHRNFDCRSKEFGTYRTLLAANYLPAMSNMMKTALIKEVGGWTEGNILEDWEMWLKLSKHHKFLLVDKQVALYRLHGRNSLDTITHKMIHSALVLVNGEKEYCNRNYLMQVWKKSHNEQLYQLLRNRDFSLNRKLHELVSAEILPLIYFLLRRVRNKVARKLGPVPR